MAEYSQGSRYRNGKFGTFRGKQVVYPRIINYASLGFAKFFTIGPGEEFRPDLISQKVYLRSDLGWHIMAANKLDSISQLKSGTTIGIPPIIGVIT